MFSFFDNKYISYFIFKSSGFQTSINLLEEESLCRHWTLQCSPLSLQMGVLAGTVGSVPWNIYTITPQLLHTGGGEKINSGGQAVFQINHQPLMISLPRNP